MKSVCVFSVFWALGCSAAESPHVALDGASDTYASPVQSSDAGDAASDADAGTGDAGADADAASTFDAGDLTCPGLAAAWGWPAYACESVVNGIAQGECAGQAWFITSDCAACCRDWRMR